MTDLALDRAPRAPTVRPAARRTSASAIATQLRDDIVGLVLMPGEALQDRLLCERFGTSRTPIREALIRLAKEGLVDIFPQSGTFVSRIPVAAIPEAVLVRQALEGVTVEAAAARIEPEGLVRLDDVLVRQRALARRQDTGGFHEADEAFHETVADLAGHPGIWRLLRQVKVQMDRARRLTLPALGRMGQVIAEHGRIRDAIAAHDPAAARSAMMDHLSIVIPDIARLQGQHPDFFL